MSIYSNDSESLGRTGQYHSGLADVLYNAFGFNTAQQANDFNAQQAALTRDFNSAEAQKQRDYEERMSNTAYQRAVADMQAAGLNTALAYSQGGASVPHAASASASSASAGSGPSGLIGGIIGAVTSLAKTAIQANSASAVADQYADSRRDIVKMNLNYKREFDNRQQITDYRNMPGGYRKVTFRD